MRRLRENPPKTLAGVAVCGFSDYLTSRSVQGEAEIEIFLPKSNVLEHRLENGCKVIIRPSGTEPKIKVYLSAKAGDREDSLALTENLKSAARELIEG